MEDVLSTKCAWTVKITKYHTIEALAAYLSFLRIPPHFRTEVHIMLNNINTSPCTARDINQCWYISHQQVHLCFPHLRPVVALWVSLQCHQPDSPNYIFNEVRFMNYTYTSLDTRISGSTFAITLPHKLLIPMDKIPIQPVLFLYSPNSFLNLHEVHLTKSWDFLWLTLKCWKNRCWIQQVYAYDLENNCKWSHHVLE